MPGDIVHCDIGFRYLGLWTDVQRSLYVLKPGEEDAPEGLRAVMADGNRLQDIVAECMALGRTGNEVLQMSRERAIGEGITPRIYCHPIGVHCHAAGPPIGLWDQQDGVPGSGDYEFRNRTCYSIELNVRKAVPEWGGQIVRIRLEEDAMFVDGKLEWLSGRQTRFHLV
jgi:methionine aminopeptidase